MSDDLEPCPFRHKGNKLIIMDNPYDGYWVACEICNTCGPTKPTEMDARAAWNRRAAEKEVSR